MFTVGKVYHQTFENGDLLYVKITKKQVNGDYSGIEWKNYHRPRKTVKVSGLYWRGIPWEETSTSDIPPLLS